MSVYETIILERADSRKYFVSIVQSRRTISTFLFNHLHVIAKNKKGINCCRNTIMINGSTEVFVLLYDVKIHVLHLRNERTVGGYENPSSLSH